MKILIIGPDPFAEKADIGPPLYIRNLLEGFNFFTEHKIFLICFEKGIKAGVEEKNKTKIYRVKEPRFLKTIFTPILIKRNVQQIIKEISPDIIDLHFPVKSGLLKGIKSPFVATVHGIVPEQLKHGILPRYKKMLFPIYERLWYAGLNNAKRVICFNRYDVEYLKDKIKARTVTIAVPRSSRYFMDKHEEKNKILSVGVLSERKNQLNILKAIRIVKEKIPDVKLFIIGAVAGEGSIKYRERLLDYISKNNLKKNARLIVGMENDEVIRQYSSAAIYIQFSTQESFPAVIIEAYAGGTPVIASSIPGTNEAVIDGETGFLVPLNDIKTLAEKIIFLLQDYNLRQKMGNKAREYAKENFLSETIAKKRIKLYKDILGI
jgi:glycosyltransferase involved in cell wall biosynthesis